MNDTDDTPCLVLSHGKQLSDQSFYSVSQNIELRRTISVPTLCDKRILTCAYGWLFLISNFRDNDDDDDDDDEGEGDDDDEDRSPNCWLWNPTAMEIIQLPYLNNVIFHKCVLSKPPTEPDCHILFVSYNGGVDAFCQIGDDEFIEHTNDDDMFIQTILVFQGIIYGMTCRHQLLAIDFGSDNGIKRLEFTALTKSEPGYPMSQPWKVHIESVLIESPCGRELLLVQNIYNGTWSFRTFRVDPHNMEIQELESIGNRVIFLSTFRGGGICRYSDNEKFKPNSIYYTISFSKNIYLYDLDDQSNVMLAPSPYPALDYRDEKFEWHWMDPQISKFFG